MDRRIKSYKELHVFQKAMDTAMAIFQLTRCFPPEEKYSMVDQMRRSSRSVCANIAESWRKRRYKGAFISKLNDAESEACETQVWIEFARRCGYMSPELSDKLETAYDQVIGKLVRMSNQTEKWSLTARS